jgi:putative polyketide hydroxylase
VLADDSAPPKLSDPVTDYVPTGRPGHRMPHQWLADGRSSLDVLGEWFTVLTLQPHQRGQLATKPWPLHHEACSKAQAGLHWRTTKDLRRSL